MRIALVLPLLFVMTATLVACDRYPDEVAKLNTVPFGGANEANIAAMVVHPVDLVRGHGTDTTKGVTATAPIQHLQTERDRKFLESGKTETGSGG